LGKLGNVVRTTNFKKGSTHAYKYLHIHEKYPNNICRNSNRFSSSSVGEIRSMKYEQIPRFEKYEVPKTRDNYTRYYTKNYCTKIKDNISTHQTIAENFKHQVRYTKCKNCRRTLFYTQSSIYRKTRFGITPNLAHTLIKITLFDIQIKQNYYFYCSSTSIGS
jgi:hypothetical protein